MLSSMGAVIFWHIKFFLEAIDKNKFNKNSEAIIDQVNL